VITRRLAPSLFPPRVVLAASGLATESDDVVFAPLAAAPVGSTGWRRNARGNVAESVVREPPVSVLVVPPAATPEVKISQPAPRVGPSSQPASDRVALPAGKSILEEWREIPCEYFLG
jgi:hypothetical protein